MQSWPAATVICPSCIPSCLVSPKYHPYFSPHPHHKTPAPLLLLLLLTGDGAGRDASGMHRVSLLLYMPGERLCGDGYYGV